MAEDAPPPADQLVKQIEEGSEQIKLLATELSGRITRFEDWLNTLKGKVKTVCSLPDPDGDDEYSFLIALDRSGKRWMLEYGFENRGDPESITFNPLSEASVELKLYALDNSRAVLEAIAKAQKRLTKKITRVQADFDKFAEEVGMNKKEAK